MAKLAETVGSATLGDFASLVASKNTSERLDYFRLMLTGISNDGKTTTAATASEFCPDQLRPGNPINLADMQWILLDSDGLAGLASLGLQVDVFDLSTIPVNRIALAVRIAIEKCGELAAAGKKKTVVFDSGSTFDCLLQAQLREEEFKQGKLGFWDAVMAGHTRVFTQLKALPCNVIFIVHVKPVMVIGDDEDKARMTAKLNSEGLKEGDLAIDISGKAARYYRNNFGLILPVRAVGKAPTRQYYIYPYGVAGMEAKCKVQNAQFSKEEPAHLGKFLAKIRASV